MDMMGLALYIFKGNIHYMLCVFVQIYCYSDDLLMSCEYGVKNGCVHVLNRNIIIRIMFL